MKAASSEFMQGIYAETRQTQATVTFPFVDPDAKEAVELVSYPTASEASAPNQMFDDDYTMVGKVAQFEPNYWKLDGSFILPLPSGQTLSQYGYWSEVLSDDTGAYPSGTYIRMFFTRPISVPGLSLLFDNKTNNFLVDFDCIAYDQNMTVLRHEEIRGNTSSRYVLDAGAVGIKYIDIVALTSNKPNRRIRILEIDFGIMLIFEGSNLFTLSLVAEADHLAESLPNGELNLTAQNDGRFDYTDPDSYGKYLQQRQQLEYRHSLVNGEDAESVDMGTYSLQSWNVTDEKVTLKAALDFSALEKHTFRKYSLTQKMNCGQLLDLIFEDAGWTNYELDPYLYESPAFLPYTGEVTNKEAMRLVAQLAGAVIFKLPDGKISIKRLVFDPDPSTVDTIDYNNSFKRTSAISSKYYNAVNLTTATLSQKDTPEGKAIVTFTDSVSGTDDFVIGHDHILYDENPVISITAGTLNSYTLYANYAFVNVTAAGEFTIEITGKTAELSTGSEKTYYAPWYQEGEEVNPYTLNLPMIFQAGQHEEIRSWCAQEKFRVLGYRLKTESTWRQNPALDTGDYISLQLDRSGSYVPVVCVKHIVNYKGGILSGSTTGVGQGQLITN